MTVSREQVSHVSVVSHHPVEVLHATAGVCVLEVEQEGPPVSVAPGVLRQPAQQGGLCGDDRARGEVHTMGGTQAAGDGSQQAGHASDGLVSVGVLGARTYSGSEKLQHSDSEGRHYI